MISGTCLEQLAVQGKEEVKKAIWVFRRTQVWASGNWLNFVKNLYTEVQQNYLLKLNKHR